MKKFFCDRCEKELKGRVFNIYVPAMPSWSNRTIEYQHMTDYMLCKDCLLSFANWLGNNFLYDAYNHIEEN